MPILRSQVSSLVCGNLTEEDIDNMKSWEHSGFNVFIGEPIDHNDKDRLLFAARYLKKCPLSNERLTIVETNGEDAHIEYASFRDGAKNIRKFTPLAFLAEVSQHIPDMWEQTTRFFGAYSSRTRGAANEREKLKLLLLILKRLTELLKT